MEIETQCALDGDSGPSIVCEMYTCIDNCKYHHISICIGFYEEVLTKTSTSTFTLCEETNCQYFIAIPLGDWLNHWIFFSPIIELKIGLFFFLIVHQCYFYPLQIWWQLFIEERFIHIYTTVRFPLMPLSFRLRDPV